MLDLLKQLKPKATTPTELITVVKAKPAIASGFNLAKHKGMLVADIKTSYFTSTKVQTKNDLVDVIFTVNPFNVNSYAGVVRFVKAILTLKVKTSATNAITGYVLDSNKVEDVQSVLPNVKIKPCPLVLAKNSETINVTRFLLFKPSRVTVDDSIAVTRNRRLPRGKYHVDVIMEVTPPNFAIQGSRVDHYTYNQRLILTNATRHAALFKPETKSYILFDFQEDCSPFIAKVAFGVSKFIDRNQLNHLITTLNTKGQFIEKVADDGSIVQPSDVTVYCEDKCVRRLVAESFGITEGSIEYTTNKEYILARDLRHCFVVSKHPNLGLVHANYIVSYSFVPETIYGHDDVVPLKGDTNDR